MPAGSEVSGGIRKSEAHRLCAEDAVGIRGSGILRGATGERENQQKCERAWQAIAVREIAGGS